MRGRSRNQSSRLIPAHAGNTSKKCTPISTYKGSSPLTRGTHPPPWNPGRTQRLIPACAGNTAIISWTSPRSAAHPRLRGEHSPRQYAPTKFRLIPACAGNTATKSHGRRPVSAHPRWRGEHSRRRPRQVSEIGSSPLARGTPRSAAWSVQKLRLIPADARNTVYRVDPRSVHKAHPRIHGEDRVPLMRCCAQPGSFPHSRRRPGRNRACRQGSRLIPAFTEKTA